MPRPPSDDAYDSDSGSEFEASDVQLGLADGPLEGDDEANPLVSRIGGRAVWLPMKSSPTQQVATCNSCKQQMQLLVQIFAPLVESAYDRCLMVWGCARPACQRKDVSSLRVIRTLKFNRRWAAKLEKQKAKRLAREQAKKEREAAAAKAKQKQEERAKVNPFAASADAGGANGGLGGMLFGGGADNPFATSTPAPAAESTTTTAASADDEDDNEEEYSDHEDSEDEDDQLAEELALKSDLEATPSNPESSWVKSSTRYPPLYLNTIPEPSSSSISKKLSKEEAAMLKSASASGTLTTSDNAANDADLKGFAKEGYEKMLLDGIDDTFERFLKRVEVEPRQAVRYEFGGEPIAFHAKGKVYDLLWPKERKAKAGEAVPVTKDQFKSGESLAGERAFTSRAVPPCPQCGAERVFEAQLMPNLINMLKADKIQAADGSLDIDYSRTLAGGEGDEEAKRKAAIEQALGRRLPSANNKAEGKGSFDARTGLVWSTAFVFTCKNDCCVPAKEGQAEKRDECWREEVILAQFEDEQ